MREIAQHEGDFPLFHTCDSSPHTFIQSVILGREIPYVPRIVRQCTQAVGPGSEERRREEKLHGHVIFVYGLSLSNCEREIAIFVSSLFSRETFVGKCATLFTVCLFLSCFLFHTLKLRHFEKFICLKCAEFPKSFESNWFGKWVFGF